jgi:hypothetical protein
MALPIYPDGRPAEWVGQVTATNRDLRPVKVNSVWIAQGASGDGRRLVATHRMLGATLPGVIEGRESGLAWFDLEAAQSQGFAIYNAALAGCVATAAGEEFRSKPRVIYGD